MNKRKIIVLFVLVAAVWGGYYLYTENTANKYPNLWAQTSCAGTPLPAVGYTGDDKLHWEATCFETTHPGIDIQQFLQDCTNGCTTALLFSMDNTVVEADRAPYIADLLNLAHQEAKDGDTINLVATAPTTATGEDGRKVDTFMAVAELTCPNDTAEKLMLDGSCKYSDYTESKAFDPNWLWIGQGN